MTPLQHAAARLCTGSHALSAQLWDATAAWIARGRRDDLTGWRAALGCCVRTAGLAAGLYFTHRIVRAAPWLMWIPAALWTLAAWRAGRDDEEDPEAVDGEVPDSGEQPPGADPRDAARTLLLTVMGPGSGVHLRAVLQHLQQQGHWEGRTVPELRAHLEALGVPTEPRVKVDRVPTRGVTRAALLALSPEREADPAPAQRLPA
ncbi:hypothetical protein [Streptomyces uncialis]|uniref:hypothetical protein n=1 Tax=Streptomyces uncialis TaxID=1048205 RepID=UPI0037B2AEA6